jgi:hypothetical protein
VSPTPFPSRLPADAFDASRPPRFEVSHVCIPPSDDAPLISDAALRRIAREHPEEFAEARAAVAARHEIAETQYAVCGEWRRFGVLFRLPDDAEYLALAAAHLRDEQAHEVVIKSLPGEPLMVHVWHRPMTPCDALTRLMQRSGEYRAPTQYARDIGLSADDALDRQRAAHPELGDDDDA